MTQSPEERRERARLRSERWRRAHGIGPRKPPERPWLAMNIVPAPHQQALEREALPVLSHAEAFTRQLQAELALAAWRHAEMAAIIAELAA